MLSEDSYNDYLEDSLNADQAEIDVRLGKVRESPFENPTEFELKNHDEVIEKLSHRVKLIMKYGQLKGSELTLYDEPPELKPDLEDSQ